MALLDCTFSTPATTCDFSMTQEEHDALDPSGQYAYIVEQNTNAQEPGIVNLTGTVTFTDYGAFQSPAQFCLDNPDGTLVYHLRDGWSGSDFAGNIESSASCTVIIPPPPVASQLTGFTVYLAYFLLTFLIFWVGKMIVKGVKKFV